MVNETVSQCALRVLELKRDLDFNPDAKSLGLSDQWRPTFAWGEQMLTNFQLDDGIAIDLKSFAPNIFAALRFCYPHLTMVELARVAKKLSLVFLKPVTEVEGPLFEQYDVRLNLRRKKLLEVIESLPPSFIDWLHARDMSFGDCEILTELPVLSSIDPVLVWIARAECSKSVGSKALEVSVEIFLRDGELKEILNRLSDNTTDSLAKLIELRYPVAAETDAKKRHALAQLDWPSGIQAKMVRVGDRTHVELNLKIASALDLTRKIKALEAKSNAMEKCLT